MRLAPPIDRTDLRFPQGRMTRLRELRRLQRVQRADPATVATAQLDRLQTMVDHAARHVPLYADLYTRVGGSRGHPLELPLLDKATWRARPQEERSAGPSPEATFERRTSGSSAEPIGVLYPPGVIRWRSVMRLRSALASGVRPWHRTVAVSLRQGEKPRRGARFPTLVLSHHSSIDEQVRAVLHFRPRVLGAHPHQLVEIGLRLPPGARPPVLSTGGTTLDPILRAAIIRLYGVVPYDHYGTVETGPIAWQCGARDLYHLDHEAVLTEVLDDRGLAVEPGGTGDVVLSNLANPLMPFLRYRIGDRATLADRPCACGYSLPALARVHGRTLDWIVDARGRRLSPQRLWALGTSGTEELFHRLRRYQIHQDRNGTVVVRLLLFEPAPAAAIETLAKHYRNLVHGRRVEVRVVDEIEDGPGGKFSFVTSDLVEAQAPGDHLDE